MKTSGSLSNKKSMKSKRGRSVSSKKHKIAKKVTGRSFKRKGTKKLRKKKIRGGDSGMWREQLKETYKKEAEAEERRYKLGEEGRETEDSKLDTVETTKYENYVVMINELNEKLKNFCGECPQGEDRAVSKYGTNRWRGEKPLENDLPEPKREEYNNFKAETKGLFRSGKSMDEKKNEIKKLQNATVEELFGGVVTIDVDDEDNDRIKQNSPPCDLFENYLTSIFYKADYKYTTSPTYNSYCSDEYSFYKIYRHYVHWLKNEMANHAAKEDERKKERDTRRQYEKKDFEKRKKAEIEKRAERERAERNSI